MKLTYCSFVDRDKPLGDGLFQCTVVIIEGHHEQLDACNICLDAGYLGHNGEFLSWSVPEEFEEAYVAHRNRAIPGEEARVLFDGRSFLEWENQDKN